jgi:hypothetical protein
MKSSPRVPSWLRLVSGLLLAPALPAALTAQSAPQDNWTLDRVVKLGISDPQWSVRWIDIDSEGSFIVIQNNSNQAHVIIFDSSGAFKKQFRFKDNFQYVFRSAPGKFYVSYNSYVEVYSSLGVFEFRIGTPDTHSSAEGYFSWNPIAIAANDGTIFVADRGNSRIQKFSPVGVFSKTFGEAGTGPGQLNGMYAIGMTPEGDVLALSDNNRLNRFNAQGSIMFNGSYNSNGWWDGPLIIAPDGLYMYARGSSGFGIFYSPNVFNWINNYYNQSTIQYNGFNRMNSDLYRLDGTSLQIWRRGFRTLGDNPSKSVPAPAVTAAKQRSNGYVDIDYIVNDVDSPAVTTALVAYRGGTSLIKDLIPLRSDALVEGTVTKIGAGVPTGVVHRVTWNPLNTTGLSSGDMVFEVLARDDRPKLIDIDYITLPTTPALTISRTPLLHSDLKTVWAWLLATGEPLLTRAGDGEIVGPGGSFTNSGNGNETYTNILGRSWLFAKLGVREATPEELQKAKLATSTSGIANQFTTSASQRMGFRPGSVNEWTFDGSGSSGGMMYPGGSSSDAWWVVPLQ